MKSPKIQRTKWTNQKAKATFLVFHSICNFNFSKLVFCSSGFPQYTKCIIIFLFCAISLELKCFTRSENKEKIEMQKKEMRRGKATTDIFVSAFFFC